MSSSEEVTKQVINALDTIDKALAESLALAGQADENLYQIGKLGRAKGLLGEFLSPLLEKHPELQPPPPWADEPLPELTEDEKRKVSSLSEATLEEIDGSLLSYVSDQPQKVARIVSEYIVESGLAIPGIPDLFYAQRIEVLVDRQLLEHRGNLKYMRYSEVRLKRN